MKNLLLFLSIFFFVQVSAQNVEFVQLKNQIHVAHPEVSLDNKIIALNFWSLDNSDSRICNKNFDKVYSIYESAKLNGGLKGIVVIAVDKNNLKSTSDIFFVKTANLSEISALIYDRLGNKIYELTTNKGNIACDGKTQTGKEAPDGTYFYIITAKGKDGQDYNKKGTLSLFR